MAETAAPASATPGAWKDPYRSYNFRISVQNVGDGHFTECSGLATKVQSIAYREAGAGPVIHRLPGHIEYGEVTLRYGLTSSIELWQWFMTGLEGRVDRRTVTIAMLDDDGSSEVMRWSLDRAWVTEWRGALLDALGREAAIESMTLVFERLERS